MYQAWETWVRLKENKNKATIKETSAEKKKKERKQMDPETD
jgi:hypothetical protein